jgi:hypothetical protein
MVMTLGFSSTALEKKCHILRWKSPHPEETKRAKMPKSKVGTMLTRIFCTKGKIILYEFVTLTHTDEQAANLQFLEQLALRKSLSPKRPNI